MLTNEIIRAWKDDSYRDSLSEEQQVLLPDNPAGLVLSEEELQQAVGGEGTTSIAWMLSLGFVTTVWTGALSTI